MDEIRILEETGDTTHLNYGLLGVGKMIKYGAGKTVDVQEAFWYDTYLMWEQLYTHGWPDENIHVLYGDGMDYPQNNDFYKAQKHQLWNITDDSCYYKDVVDIFQDLRYGNPSRNILPMTDNDNLFVFTYDHGEQTNIVQSVDISDVNNPILLDTVFLQKYISIVTKIYDGYFYITDCWGLHIININDPYNMFFESHKKNVGLKDISFNGDNAYTVKTSNIGNFFDNKLYKWNITDKTNPFVVDSQTLNAQPNRIECGEYIYVLLSTKILKISYGLEFVDSLMKIGIYRFGITRYRNEEVLIAGGYNKIYCFRTGDFYPCDSITITGVLNCLKVESSERIYIIKEKRDFYILSILDGEIEVLESYTAPVGYEYLDLVTDENQTKAFITTFIKNDTLGGISILDIRNPSNIGFIGYYPITRKNPEGGIVRYENYLFVYSIQDQGKPDSNVVLNLMDYSILDRDFAYLVNNVPANKKIFWMQQCFGGGFIDNLENENTIIATASRFDEPANFCDDRNPGGVYHMENETLTIFGKKDTVTHCEFIFHLLNSVRGSEIYPYNNALPVFADLDSNRGVSMWEAFRYGDTMDSYRYGSFSPVSLIFSNIEPEVDTVWEHPQYSDLGNIGSSTYLEWDDFLPPSVPSGFSYRYKRDTDTNWGINLIWNDNREVDFSGYNLWRFDNFIKKLYYDTTYIDYAMGYRGQHILYKSSGFDLWGYESGKRYLSLFYPIGISDNIYATAGNNGRRIFYDRGKVHLFYSSGNNVYYITSEDIGKSWSLPYYIGEGRYPVCDKITNGVIVLWVKDTGISYRLMRNGVWENEIVLGLPESYIPEERIFSVCPPSIAVTRDTVHIFSEFVIEYIGRGYRFIWCYGKFHIDNPSFSWVGIDGTPGYIPQPRPLLSPTIRLKNNIPLLSYDKENKIYYAQRIGNNFRKWLIGSGHSPCIDYSNQCYLAYVDSSGTLRMIQFTPPNDTILNWSEMSFKEPVHNVEEPFILGADYLLWSEYDSSNGYYKVRYTTFNPDSFYWDLPLNLSSIEWGDAYSPQRIVIRWREETQIKKRLISVWAEGIEPDIGINKSDASPIENIFAMVNLGGFEPSPFTVQREGYIDYRGEKRVKNREPVKRVDYHPEMLVYRIYGLNPEYDYRIRLGLYQNSNERWKERIEVDKTPIGEKWLYPGEVLWIEKKIPNVDIQDGEIEIRLIKKEGDYAVCGVLYLYEDMGSGVATSKEFRVFDNDRFYIKPMIGFIEMNIPEEMNVSMRIYDITGRCVSVPIENKKIQGEKKVYLKELPEGIYFYRVMIGKKEYKGKIVNIR